MNLWADNFKKNLAFLKNEKIAIYGISTYTKEILDNCPDFYIEFLLDGFVFEGNIYDKEIVKLEELVKKKIKYIVIVARASSESIIYKRICKFCKNNNIIIYNIYGENLFEEKNEEKEIIDMPNPYELIDMNNIISFDMFETLVYRGLVLRENNFKLINTESNVNVIDFDKKRIFAEYHIGIVAPKLDKIYEFLKIKYKIKDDDALFLIKLEIEYENRFLIRRESVFDLYEYAIRKDKKIYITTDMYYEKELLEALLNYRGISQFEDIIISSDYGVSKKDGLFDVLLELGEDDKILHIGDDKYLDGDMAKKSKITPYIVDNIIGICGNNKIIYGNSVNEDYITGLINCKNLKNNSFEITEDFQLGYAIIGPLLTGFLTWILKEYNDKNSKLCLLSRDCFLINEMINIYYKNEEKNKIIYLEFSRTVGTKILENRGDFLEFLNYANEIIGNEKIIIVDFVSSGTCQLDLEKILDRKIEGLYLGRIFNEEKRDLDIKTYYNNELLEKSELLKYYLFLEMIIKDIKPTVIGYKNGVPEYKNNEVILNEQVVFLNNIHKGALTFFRDYIKLFPVEQETISCEYIDSILGLLSKKSLNKLIVDMEKFCGVDSFMNRQIKFTDFWK